MTDEQRNAAEEDQPDPSRLAEIDAMDHDRLLQERERLEKEGFVPGPRLLAEKLNVRESDVVEMEQRLALPEISVDAPPRTTRALR